MLQLTRPLTAQLEITDRCNFRCRHCYHLDFDCKRDSQDLSDEEIMLIATKLAENQIFSVILTGGEPLIKKNLVKKIVTYLKGHNTDVSLNTNLQFLDSKTLDEFMASGLDGALISCPSTNPETYNDMTGGGNFLRFLARLKMVIKCKQHFSVNMVVNRHNLGGIRQSAEFLRDLGVKIFGATPMGLNLENPDLKNLLTLPEVRKLVEDLVWIKENLGLEVDIFEALPKCAFPDWVMKMDLPFLNRRCQAGKTVISVANNGDVRPCSHNPDVFGNVLNEPLTVIWQRMTEWRNFQTIPKRCHICKMLINCFGGCRITARAYTGDYQGEDPWMDSPIAVINRPARLIQRIDQSPKTSIAFAKIFRWRHESEDNYIITSTRNNRNITMVNGELLSFVRYLKESCPLKLSDLATRVKRDLKDREFQRIIQLLITREFIFPQPIERR